MRVQDVAQGRDAREQHEKHDVKHEENDGDDLEPVPVVRQLVQQNGNDASAHCDDEPSINPYKQAASPPARGQDL